jgi:hypothetical protein
MRMLRVLASLLAKEADQPGGRPVRDLAGGPG